MMNLLKSLKPIYTEDNHEWKELMNQNDWKIPPLFWYGGAAFDKEPIAALLNNSFPSDVRSILSSDIFPILTDYDKHIVKAMKIIYEHLDDNEFDLITSLSNYWFNGQLAAMEVNQMIPLTLFNTNELERIRHNYNGYNSSAIPDDQWHFVYIDAGIDGKSCGLIYGLIENLAFWKEIVEVYNLNIEAFCALRVGGKSGSWDLTHSPKNGQLFNSIHISKSRKPKVWIADDCHELKEIWKEIEPHENGYYGQMHYFETEWKP